VKNLEYFCWCLWEEERYHLYLIGEDVVVNKALFVSVGVYVYAHVYVFVCVWKGGEDVMGHTPP